MATDYLRRDAAASVPGIRLICKYLMTSGPARTSQIQAALRPPAVVPRADGEGATMPASLEVARDLGLLAADGGPDPLWSPGPGLTALQSAPAILGTSDGFRPLILRALSRRALELAGGEEPHPMFRWRSRGCSAVIRSCHCRGNPREAVRRSRPRACRK